MIPNYDYVGDACCRHLSVLYGKRFDNHGSIEGAGVFHLPTFNQFGLMSLPSLPQNSHEPRADFPVPLDLGEARRLLPLWFGQGQPPLLLKFNAACKFYLRALQVAERDPEVAYLHLISSGEILADSVERPKDVLLDDEIKGVLARIEAEMCGGRKLARMLRGRMRQLKRGFIHALSGLVDQDFFCRGEAKHDYGRLKADSFAKALGAAYDLRSRYVHTGTPFSIWVRPDAGNDEVQSGRPITGDEELSDILAAAPTYIGLERVVRYCLLRFAATNFGLDVTSPVQQ